MKKNLILIGIIIFLVGAVSILGITRLTDGVSADTEEYKNTIVVNGVGSISVKADIAYIDIGVETENIEASIAQSENALKMSEVMEAIISTGISADDIKTTNYTIYDRYNYADEKDDKKYYFVSNTLQLTIRDIDAVGDIIDITSSVGANQISNIRFGISNEDEVYAEALKLAMLSAENKATSIMGTFDQAPGTPSKVNESGYNSGVIRESYDIGVASRSEFSTPISAGDLEITANISVEYNY